MHAFKFPEPLAVNTALGIQRVRAGDDPRSSNGWPGSSAIVGQGQGRRPFKIDRIRAVLNEGRVVRETARLLKVSATKVSEVRRPLVLIDPHPLNSVGGATIAQG